MVRRTFLDRLGIVYRWRASMTLPLVHLFERPALPLGYEIVPWDPSRLDEVAAVDYSAYRDTIDGLLYWPYFSSVPGCRRMWEEAIAGKFGRFDPDRTLLLLKDGRVCGDLIASVRSWDEAFIGNLAVAPQHRGGTGKALLLSCLWRYKEAGLQRVSLAVTYHNERAYQLYANLGFVVTGRFPVVTRPGSS